MPTLIVEAYGMLIHFDRFVVRGDFPGLYRDVRRYPVHNNTQNPDVVDRICFAVDRACIWYWKQVLCLQRSAATTCLMKRHGVRAQLVIGAQHVPFKAHAWVEVAGRVVNDKPYMPEIYAVLDRC